ncbi:hypothetical protein ACFSVJ_11940 [Prauserella oleivorans]
MQTRESDLRRAAFGDDPGLGDRVLAAADGPRERWLAAVVLGARGRYAAAASILQPLARGTDDVAAALAGSTLASHRRQLGGHAAAQPLDGAALARALGATGTPDDDGLDPAGARADALLGLAADNLALGRLTASRRLIAAAAEHVTSWRTRVRAGWVSAEVALAGGAPRPPCRTPSRPPHAPGSAAPCGTPSSRTSCSLPHSPPPVSPWHGAGRGPRDGGAGGRPELPARLAGVACGAPGRRSGTPPSRPAPSLGHSRVARTVTGHRPRRTAARPRVAVGADLTCRPAPPARYRHPGQRSFKKATGSCQGAAPSVR